jgi:hypothetical protein
MKWKGRFNKWREGIEWWCGMINWCNKSKHIHSISASWMDSIKLLRVKGLISRDLNNLMNECRLVWISVNVHFTTTNCHYIIIIANLQHLIKRRSIACSLIFINVIATRFGSQIYNKFHSFRMTWWWRLCASLLLNEK